MWHVNENFNIPSGLHLLDESAGQMIKSLNNDLPVPVKVELGV